jgi:hypothetical protein
VLLSLAERLVSERGRAAVGEARLVQQVADEQGDGPRAVRSA